MTEVIEAGASAGFVGGVAMALFATVYEAAIGAGFWTPLKAVAALVLGPRMEEAGASAAFIGLVVHMLTSVTVGVLFASVTPRDVSPVPALALGAFAGVAVLVLMNLIILPTYGWTAPGVLPPARARLMWGGVPGTMPIPIVFVIHLIYGAGLGLAPWLRRRFGARGPGRRT